MPKTIYVCEYCHKQYETRTAARLCEVEHETTEGTPQYLNKVALRLIISNDESPCLACQRGYFVYGSEFNCDCEKYCKEYSHFILKNKI